MRRLAPALLAVFTLPLSACGSLGTAPQPSAGQLLRAPTSLNLAGRTLSAEATPQLSGTRLNLQVKVSSSGSRLPLNVRSVYLVTQGGVWSAPARWKAGACPSCRRAQGQGPAAGLQSGESVQVVVQLQDSAGRNFWLRDDQVRVTR